MRIVIVASGTWGDVRPNAVLGQALQNAGYEVLLLAAEEFRQWVEARGIAFTGLSVNVQTILDMLIASNTDPVSTIQTIRATNRLFAPATLQMGKEIAAAVREGDVLLMNEWGLSLMNGVVEKHKLRVIHVNMQPFAPTSEFPPMGMPVVPSWMPLRGVVHRRVGGFVRRMNWSMMGARGNQLRTEHLELPKQSFAKHQAMLNSTPSLLLASRHVIPVPADWGSQHRITGYLFDEDSAWEAPQDLLNFLANGEKPVYIGFGSMRVRKPEATTKLVLDAVQRSGKRAVLLSGWAGIGAQDMHKDVFLLNYAPHLWLFPHMAAVVHHGGAGTTAAGFKAGVPSVIVPILADQPFWARRAYEMGVGTKPIPPAKLTADILAAAINEATSNQMMLDKSAALGQKIAAEDGVSEAVGAVREFLN